MQISNCISYIPGNNVPDSRKASELSSLIKIKSLSKEFTTSVPPKGMNLNSQSSIIIDTGLSQTENMDIMLSWATFAKIPVSLANIFLISLDVPSCSFFKTIGVES